MNRNEELNKNMVIFSLGTVGSKTIQFFLVPLYTTYLTSSEYSVSEMLNSVVTMLVPFLTLGLGNGILRFSNKSRKKGILLPFSLKICIIGTFLLTLCVPFLKKTGYFRNYEFYIPLLFLFCSLKNILSCFCKSIDKNKEFSLDGIISTSITCILSYVFIRIMSLSIRGYLLAILIANMESVIYFYFICDVKNEMKCSIKNDLAIMMLKYSLPLIPNDISWWVIQMSDRFMITNICGSSANGVYSIAYKIPGIFNIIVSVFISAFSLSLFKEIDDKKNDNKQNNCFIQEIYKKYLAITIVSASIIILSSRVLALFFIKKDFYESWRYTPFLLIAFAIGNIETFYGSVIAGYKKTQINMISTMLGATVNVVLNYVLIGRIGINGAIVSSIISYFVVYLVRAIGIKRNILLDIKVIKTIASFVILLVISFLYTNSSLVVRHLSFLGTLILVIIYKAELSQLFVDMKRIINVINVRKHA